MNAVVLKSNPACTACDLHEGAASVCIPARPAFPPSGTRQVILVVGENPGRLEDEQNRAFVGPSGRLLDAWIQSCGFRGAVDVFYANCARCRTPRNVEVSISQYRACSAYLLDDLSTLYAIYGRGLTLLLTGGTAIKRVSPWNSLDSSLLHQGEPIPFTIRHPHRRGRLNVSIPAFYTYHPAFTLPGRSPQSGDAVKDHLRLLCRFLNTGSACVDLKGGYTYHQPPVAPLYCIDIETYGILATAAPQTVFDPRRSLYSDGCALDDLIVCAAVHAANGDPRGESTVYDCTSLERREALCEFLRCARRSKATLLGQNLPFDLRFLRACGYPVDHRTRVEDLLVWNYLDSDVRRERGLKQVSRLFGTHSYAREKPAVAAYDDPRDPRLYAYVAHDVQATLKNRCLLRDRIERRYGADSPKLSAFTRRWYSDLIWCAVYMSETGVGFSLQGLRTLRRETRRQLTVLCDSSPIPLLGAGSGTAVVETVERACARYGLLNEEEHPELEKTKAGDVRSSESNLNYIRAHMKAGDPLLARLDDIAKSRALKKRLGTYIHPLVGPFKRVSVKHPAVTEPVPDRTQELIPGAHKDIGVAHPSWFIVPSPYEKRDTAGSAGTKQSRVTCKSPALQTFEHVLLDQIRPRTLPGYVLKADLSQIELRDAAHQSGDPRMLEEYETGIDRHWARACQIFGSPCPEHGTTRDRDCDTCTKSRFVGKTANFLILYRGGWWKLRFMVRQDAGLELEKKTCRRIVTQMRTDYPVFYAWQDALIEQISKDGYWEDPIIGAGRRFTTSWYANKLDESTLCNLPIQSESANIMLAAQVPLTLWLMSHRRLKSRVTCNIYDAVLTDGPIHEADHVVDALWKRLVGSTYLQRLEDLRDRPFPMAFEYEIHEFDRRGRPTATRKGARSTTEDF